MSRRFFAYPFLLWIACGTIIPLAVIMFYGFTDRSGVFTFDNITAILSAEHAKALWLSLLLSVASTVICFLLAFPLALILKGSRLGQKGFMVFIFILPMWMNFLLRTMAWQVILEKGGLINSLPFMVLPIYNTLMKIDDSIIEAAYDLGAGKRKVLTDILLPLSIPGIASGVTMVFVPSLTTFVISNMLGGGKIYLIGNIIEQEFTTSSNWNLGSGLSLIMMVFIVLSMAALSKLDKNGEGTLI